MKKMIIDVMPITSEPVRAMTSDTTRGPMKEVALPDKEKKPNI